MQRDENVTEERHLPKRKKDERDRNHFIIGALIGGLATYILSRNNLLLTMVGSIVAGILATKFWDRH